MGALAAMATQLQRDPLPPPPAPPEEKDSRAGRMRAALREQGSLGARALAAAVGLRNSGLVGALLKHDIQAGRVQFHDGVYSWNPTVDEMPPACPGALREVLDWHEVADGDFPDAELTVIGRLRGNEEPVWLVFWTGEDWQDIDGQPVDVVRWCDMPRGGEV
jgi:hypothetical protein